MCGDEAKFKSIKIQENSPTEHMFVFVACQPKLS